MNLKDVAAVRSGLVLARKQANGTTQYQYRLLNLKAVNPGGYLDLEQIEIFNATEPLNPEYLTHAGDLVIRLSIPYTAVLIDTHTENMVIPSSFVVVRTNRNQLLPEYLFWLLNTEKVRQQIYENATGNMLGAIKPSFFRDFRFALLTLADQKKIAELNSLAHRETTLLRELAAEKEKYYAHMIDNIQKEMRRGN